MTVVIDAAAAERRAELSDFLRTRRARLAPSDVGLAEGRRRRTPGLRREEVALLANIGATWYTRLEQGLPINVSSDVLDAIARALRLTRPERRHLFTLAGHTLDEAQTAGDEVVSAILRRSLDAIPTPAFVRGRHSDLLAFNDAWRRALCYRPSDDYERRNLLIAFFTEPESRERHPQWEVVGAKIVASFRAVAARYPEDPRFREIIDHLSAVSADFRKWWAQHDVYDAHEGMKHFFHPSVGELYLDHLTLLVPDHPDMRLIIYTAEPGSESAEKLRLLTSSSTRIHRSAHAPIASSAGSSSAPAHVNS